jgi:hypothetical protein
MKRYLLNVFLFLAVQAVPAGALLWKWSHSPSDGYPAAILDKHRRLASLPPPRIIFIGGSGAAFGLDSPRIERELERNAVNMGLYARLGPEFMLSEVKSSLRSHDVVVLLFDYSLWIHSASRDALDEIVFIDLRSLGWMSWPDLHVFLDRGHRAIGAEARRTLRDWLLGADPEPALPPYSRASFNDHGDVVAHESMKRPAIQATGFRLPHHDSDLLRDRMTLLNDFFDHCRSRDVSVFFAYPPMMRETYSAHEEEIVAFHGLLKQKLRMPILGTPADTSSPGEYFFDTPDHLTAEGKARRTTTLIGQLRSAGIGR